MNKDNINVKGLVASCINECNEILFTEIIYNNYFNDLDEIELACLLTIFIESKNENDYSISELHIEHKSNLKNIFYLHETIMKEIDKYQLYLDNDWNLYTNLINPTYDWLKGQSFNYVLKEYSLYSGNFTKHMLKLNSIVESLIDAAKHLNNMKVEPLLKLKIIDSR